MTSESYFPERYSSVKISPRYGQSSILATRPVLTEFSRTYFHFSECDSLLRSRWSKNVFCQCGGVTPFLLSVFEMVFFKDFIQAEIDVCSSLVATNRCK